MASQAHGEPITGSSLTANPFSTKKKKIQSQKLNPINPSRCWRLASRRVVASREIKPQYKSKPNTELSKPNTEHRGVYQKKKIPNTQTKIKPSKPLTHGRSHRRRHRRSELVVVIVVRLVAPHRRSEIRERRSLCLCSGARRSPLSAPSDPPSRYFALFSL